VFGCDEEASPCCDQPAIASCTRATINSSELLSRQALALPGTSNTFTFRGLVEPRGIRYTTLAGDEALLTVNTATGRVFGTFTTMGEAGTNVYILESCGDHQVWLQFHDNIEPELPEHLIAEHEHFFDGNNHGVEAEFELDRAMPEAATDSTTMAEYSVMIYYTPQFARITRDIPGFLDQVVTETNLGYANSKIPLRIRIHCVEEASINDDPDGGLTGINNSRWRVLAMKKDLAALRNTADTVVVLFATLGHISGYAPFRNSIADGNTLVLCTKAGALGRLSFGHELAHTMGAWHNVKQAGPNPDYPHGNGHLLDLGKAESKSGFRSIMSYSDSGHQHRINYYSNPRVRYWVTNTPTGTQDDNNADIIIRNRMALQAIGDESSECHAALARRTTEAGEPCVLPFTFQGATHTDCTTRGAARPWCPTATGSGYCTPL